MYSHPERRKQRWKQWDSADIKVEKEDSSGVTKEREVRSEETAGTPSHAKRDGARRSSVKPQHILEQVSLN